jgi:hypothetical protein
MIEEKVATQKTQDKYSQSNFEELLARIATYKDAAEPLKIVDSIRSLAEFICYSEQYKLNYFDSVLMSTDVLLVDLPRILQFDNRTVNTQLIQTVSILVQNIDDTGNLTVLLGADLIRQLIEVDCTFDDELIDYYISFLKTLVMRLSKMPYLINLFYNNKLKIYPLFIQAQ